MTVALGDVEGYAALTFNLTTLADVTVTEFDSPDGTVYVNDGGLLTIDEASEIGTLNVDDEGSVLFQDSGSHLMNALTISDDGLVTFEESSGEDKVLVAHTLTISGGTLDLKDNDLIVSFASVSTIRSYIFAGYGGGGWLGDSGIKGTGTPPEGKTALLGYAQGDDAAVAHLDGILDGESFGDDSVIIVFTYQGDGDLDIDVDGVDVGIWSGNFTGAGGSTSKLWTEGDWDYDGDVDGADVGYWSGNYTGSL
jgi:hypothetical protein